MYAHRVIVLSLLLTGLIDRDNVLVFESRGDLRLEPEAIDHRRVIEGKRPDQLQRDDPVHPAMVSAVDDPHSPLADRTDQVIVADPVVAEDRPDDRGVAGEAVEILRGRRGIAPALPQLAVDLQQFDQQRRAARRRDVGVAEVVLNPRRPTFAPVVLVAVADLVEPPLPPERRIGVIPQ